MIYFNVLLRAFASINFFQAPVLLFGSVRPVSPQLFAQFNACIVSTLHPVNFASRQLHILLTLHPVNFAWCQLCTHVNFASCQLCRACIQLCSQFDVNSISLRFKSSNLHHFNLVCQLCIVPTFYNSDFHLNMQVSSM